MRDRKAALTATLLLLSLCFAPFSARAQSTVQEEANSQRRFEQGVEQLFAGQHLAAAATFEALYQDTLSDRVKLEWARALYLAGDHEQATALFREVMANDPPLAVADRVSALIRDMELQRLKLDFTLGVATDTNPRAISSAESFNLFGYDFVFDPGVERGKQIGVSYGISASKSFGDLRRYIASVAISGNEFDAGDFDHLTVTASGLYYVSLLPRLYLRPGFEFGYFAHRPLYHVPYLTLGGSSNVIIPEVNLGLELTVGEISYPAFDFLDAIHYAASLIASKYINENWNASLQLSLTRNEASSAPYTSSAYGIQASSSFALPVLSLVVQPQLGYTFRHYAGRDVLFGVVREDRRLRGRLGVELRGIEVRGFAPVLELSWEENSSNIALYSYTRGIWGISFRRTY